MSKHEIVRPDIVPVPMGHVYSKNVGGEQRRTSKDAAAPFDGVAVNGVLFSMQEYMVPVMWMLEFVKEREKNVKKPRAKKAKR